MSHGLDERVQTLEEKMDRLSNSVDALTTTLNSGKLALKMFLGLCAIGASIISAIHWIATHVSINGN